jgi:hypothetical protein
LFCVAAGGTLAPAANAGWVELRGPRTLGSQLDSVSCLPSAVCAAVGSTALGLKDEELEKDQLVIGLSPGGWSSFATSPLAAGRAKPELTGVSCTRLTSCTAVGYSVTPGYCEPGSCNAYPLTEQWNGKAWSPGEGAVTGRIDAFSAVSCTSRSFCVAVGNTTMGEFSSNPLPLAESWNGAAWSVMPNAAASEVGDLEGVSCVSSSFCVAVGLVSAAGGGIETWNGTEWSEDPSAPSAVSFANLSSVSCVGGKPTSCTVVGHLYGNERGTPLIAESSGGKWTKASAAAPAGGGKVSLTSVSCVARGRCAAVGSDEFGEESIKTVVYVERAGHWSLVPSANATTGFTLLDGVSCTPVSFARQGACVAVGYSYSSERHAGESRPFILYGTL